MTLNIFEKYLPGTAEIYMHGPYGLPLWALIDGDLSASIGYLWEQFPAVSGQFDASIEVRA